MTTEAELLAAGLVPLAMEDKPSLLVSAGVPVSMNVIDRRHWAPRWSVPFVDELCEIHKRAAAEGSVFDFSGVLAKNAGAWQKVPYVVEQAVADVLRMRGIEAQEARAAELLSAAMLGGTVVLADMLFQDEL